MSLSPSELSQLINERIAPRAFEIVQRSSVPIFYWDDRQDEIKRDRSGVLYTVGGKRFILTALHDLPKLSTDARRPSFVYGGKERREPLPLGGLKVIGSDRALSDVAVIELDDNTAEALSASFEFANHSNIVLKDESPHSLYGIFGFPGSLTREVSGRMVSEGFALLAQRHQGRIGTDHFDPAVHVAVEMKDELFRPGTGKSERFRDDDISGISGCGIWRIMQEVNEVAALSWKPTHVSLCAVQHRWHRGRSYAQGTWIDYALTCIAEEYPEVRSAMKIIYDNK